MSQNGISTESGNLYIKYVKYVTEKSHKKIVNYVKSSL